MNRITKKLIAMAAACTLCLSASPLTANAATYYYKGDVNNSGSVDVADVTVITQYLRGILSADGIYAERLDVNRDYVIDDKDLQEIKKIVIKTAQTQSVRSVDTTMTTAQETTRYYKYNAQTGNFINYYDLAPVPNISPSGVSTQLIIGNDDRVIDYSKSGIVKVHKAGYTSTGFVVGNHTILTAAHCVFRSSDIQYTLYNSDGTEKATYNAVSYHVPEKHIHDIKNPEYDYAIITVAEDLSSYKCFNIGVCRDGIVTPNPDIYVTGFAYDPSPSRPELEKKMVTGSGKFTENIDGHKILPKILHYNTDTIGGTSGSPIYVKDSNGIMTVIGIHTGSISNSTLTYNRGRRIDSNVLHFIYNNSYLN